MIAAAIALWLGILIFVPATEDGLDSAFPRLQFLSDIKSAFLSSLGQVSDAEALVAGLAIGERDLLSESAQNSMREVSLTHLVAVSGANLAIVMGAVWFLLGYLGLSRNLRFLFSGLSLVGYILLVGPEPSVIRAGAMAFAVLFAMALGRGSNPLHALALAVVVLLLLDQSLATDLGFALSVVATAGLLIGANPIAKRLGFLPLPLALALGAGIAAQVFTLPVMVLIQSGFPIFGIAANLLVEPVVAPVTVLGILSVLSVPFSEPISNLAAYLATFGTDWILGVASFFSSPPQTRLHLVGGFEGQLLLWALVVLLASAVSFEGGARRVATTALGVVSIFVLLLSSADVVRHHRALSDWDLISCDVGQGDAVLVRSMGIVALIDVGKEPDAIQDCLLQAGVVEVDLLILTHYDLDHVGGIAGLGQISIKKVLVSGYEDDRPVVGVVDRFLVSKGVFATESVAGQSADFGDCTLQVIAPINPQLAESSNDASIVTFFDCPRFQFLNLADTGEVAQGKLLSSVRALVDLNRTRIVKVAHHGSKDQSQGLYEAFMPDVAIYSVGQGNTYGHPTNKALAMTERLGAVNLRTDISGAIGVHFTEELELYTAGKLST